jgi:hypothetical protein
LNQPQIGQSTAKIAGEAKELKDRAVSNFQTTKKPL